MKKLISILLIFILLVSAISLSSCTEDETNLDVKSYEGFVAFVFGIDSDATNFFANYKPFATTRSALDSFLKLFKVVSAGLKNMTNKLISVAKSIIENPVNLFLTIVLAILCLIAAVFVLALTGFIAIFLLVFFYYALIFDVVMVSLYGFTVGFVFMLRALVYVLIDLGVAERILKFIF